MEEVKKKRCSWVSNSEIHKDYHDKEWGVPIYDDKELYETLVLETFTTGLSWLIILKKRENFRKAFDNFDPDKVAEYDEQKVEELCKNTDIIRSPGKIKATISNTRIFKSIQKEYGTFSKYIWGYTDNKIIKNTDNRFNFHNDVAVKISEDLKKRGMKYVGPVTVNAFLEAMGMINNHETECFRYNEL
ncbi:MAG: DNA-3-methyladenine glycosylase I [Clostridia bacterium]|nr:DNA-3-methyladenine glycosylase I [Clostridia bacterium]